MNLDSHKKTLGILHLVYGIFTALVFLFIGSLASIFIPFIEEAIIAEEGPGAEKYIDLITGVIQTAFLLLLIFSAIPSIIGGIGLVSKKSWGLVIAMIAGCISLLSFPFGTALGVYSIYVFVNNNKQKVELSEG